MSSYTVKKKFLHVNKADQIFVIYLLLEKTDKRKQKY